MIWTPLDATGGHFQVWTPSGLRTPHQKRYPTCFHMRAVAG